jgi:hypothetical protein
MYQTIKKEREMKEEFIEFLKTWGVYEIYEKAYDPVREPKDETEFLLCAFVWVGTPEGGKFWYEVHMEWCGYLNYWKDSNDYEWRLTDGNSI